MDRIKAIATRNAETGNGTQRTSRLRVVLPPSEGNASLLPLPLPESLWPADAVQPRSEASLPRAAMFVPRVTVRSMIVAAALALSFVGCARSALDEDDPRAGTTAPSAHDEDGAYGPMAAE